MRQTATLSGGKVDWPMAAHAAPAVPKIAGTRKMWGYARLPKGHERSFLQALRSRVLVALHRDAEAKNAAQEASKFCVEAGRQSCDGARLVEYSKRLMKTNWD